MKTFVDHMCVCKDNACADRVSSEMTEWRQEFGRKQAGKPELNMSAAQKKEMEAAMTRLGECTVKAMHG